MWQKCSLCNCSGCEYNSLSGNIQQKCSVCNGKKIINEFRLKLNKQSPNVYIPSMPSIPSVSLAGITQGQFWSFSGTGCV